MKAKAADGVEQDGSFKDLQRIDSTCVTHASPHARNNHYLHTRTRKISQIFKYVKKVLQKRKHKFLLLYCA